MTEYIAVMENVSKTFAGTLVLRGVSLHIRRGETVTLLGDNGAGKSTLMQILSGAIPPDSGRIVIDGEEIPNPSVAQMRRLGVEMVYQDLALCNTLSVADNLFLGREHVTRIGMSNRKRMREEAARFLEEIGIKIKSTQELVGNLSGGQKQAIAIARAISFQPKLLIMDEPTSALAVAEVNQVLDLVKRVNERGVAVVYITHRLQDVFSIAHRVVVLYEGTKVAEGPVSEFNLERIVSEIVGGNFTSKS